MPVIRPKYPCSRKVTHIVGKRRECRGPQTRALAEAKSHQILYDALEGVCFYDIHIFGLLTLESMIAKSQLRQSKLAHLSLNSMDIDSQTLPDGSTIFDAVTDSQMDDAQPDHLHSETIAQASAVHLEDFVEALSSE